MQLSFEVNNGATELLISIDNIEVVLQEVKLQDTSLSLHIYTSGSRDY